MNWEDIQNRWTELQAEATKQWEKLSASDWDQIAGQWNELVAKLQEQYNWTYEQAEAEINKFFSQRNS